MEILSPGVQHAQEADLRAKVLWIGGDRTQRLRRRLEQDIVDHGLVLEGDGLDLRWYRENDVEVGHVEQFRLTVLKPFGSCETLTLRAAVVATRIVGKTLMAAIAAPLNVAAERGGAATLDRDHGAPPGGGQRCGMLITKSRAEAAEHIRHFGSPPSLLRGHRNLGTTAQYLMIATSKVCATASPLESLDVLVPTAPDLMPA